ncbi:MAG: TlpA family protein disulfide reductase [Flavobacteriaceae bacterium]|nr:TlpA family protein disulfide reductase [Flavobacteriaceae bacterium]
MRQLPALIFTLLLFSATYAQSLPYISLKTLENKGFQIKLLEKEPLVIISFWATWCSNCIYELDEIKELYSDWQKQTGVKIIAVSIDDYRTISRVKPFVKSHQWPYKILLDTNQKLKRALNISNIPEIIILKKGKIVYQHSGYTPGNEDAIFDILIQNIQ